jgi:hypothetical protein
MGAAGAEDGPVVGQVDLAVQAEQTTAAAPQVMGVSPLDA